MKQLLTSRGILLIVAGLFLLAALLWVVQRDQGPDWQPSWSVEDRDPFGAELFVELLQDRFAPLSVGINKQSPLELWQEESPQGEVYVVVNHRFDPNYLEWEALSDFAWQGNTLFVAASGLGPTASEDLSVELKSSFYLLSFNPGKDTTEVTFADSTWPSQTFRWPSKDVGTLNWEPADDATIEDLLEDAEEEEPGHQQDEALPEVSIEEVIQSLEEQDSLFTGPYPDESISFDSYDDAYYHDDAGPAPDAAGDEPSRILLKNEAGEVVGLQLSWGAGRIILCSLPKAFTNYGVLTEGYSDMAAGMLSYLPEQPTRVWWDEWIKVGNRRRQPDEGEESPDALSYIWEREALRMALLLALLGLLLLAIFQTRRVQAIIPIRPPLPNLTLDFVDTVGRLYFRSSHHRQLALKRVATLREHIQEKYLLPETWGSQAFVRILAAKSGQSESFVLSMVQAVQRVEQANTIDEIELIRLSELIEHFMYSPQN